MGTLMHTNAQRLLNHRSAPATALRCSAWINLDIRPTSISRFVARIGSELIPCCIRDAFRQTVVFEHSCDAQILKHDDAKTINQLSAFLMGKVLAPIRYSLMDTSEDLAPSCSLWRSLRLFAQAALRPLQVMLIAAKETRVVYYLASRKRGEFLKTDIHADSRFRHVGGLLIRFLNGKGDKPLTGTASPQGDSLNTSFDGTMKIDQHRANSGKEQSIAFEPRPVPVLRVGHTVVSTKALEAWITGVVGSLLYAAKERLKGQIDPHLNILQDLAMHQLERFALGFPIRKHRLGVIQFERFLTLFPGITAHRKRLIVDPSAFLKLLLKDALLAFGQMQTVLICGFTQIAHTVYYNLISGRTQVLSVRASAFHWLSATAFIPGLKARGFLPPFL